MKVLLSAFACDPARGSEDAVGWGWARAIARHHEVHVITAAFQRERIEAWLGDHPGDDVGMTFHYVPPRRFHYRPTPRWTRIENSALKPLMNLAYAQWMRDAGTLARSLDEEHDYDLVHLVTYVGYRFPGTYYRMGKPFVWGPIGGLENTPWRFLPRLGLYGGAYHAVRNVINGVQRRMLPSVRRAMRSTDLVIAATSGIRRQVERCYRRPAEVVCEVGLPGEIAQGPTRRAPGEPLRIAWSGLHLPRKALPFLLEALARLPAAEAIELRVLGRGPCTKAWRARADALGVSGRVRWTGWIPREDALAEMRAAHVFVITSVEDLTSTVLVEALGHGLPVVCAEACGFGDVVDASCGITIPLTTPEAFVAGLAAAIATLAGDEERRRELARGALRRARDFTWDAKADRLASLYDDVASAGAVGGPC
ncbi:MAG: glycosyltransferase [Planctomycetota bacterium]|nr:glycosyltransferase [Planctomycetota bacterium]